MSNQSIKIQLCLPPGDPNGSFITADRKVKIHSTGPFLGKKAPSSGSEYITQREGIVELSADWREHSITALYVYDEKGRTEYALKENVYIPRDGNALVRVQLRKS